MATRITWISIVAASLACLSAIPADAAEPGFYVTAVAGSADESPKSNGTNFGNSLGVIHLEPDQVSVDTGSFAWGAGLGYRINKYLAGELEYMDFGITDVREHYNIPNMGQFPVPTELELNYSSRVTGPAVSLLGTLPVGQNIELFLRGGALFSSREYGQDLEFASTVWLAGAGATWSFAKRWGMRAEYQQTGTLEESLVVGETKLKKVSLSALFRF
jgi:hypothetical protein